MDLTNSTLQFAGLPTLLGIKHDLKHIDNKIDSKLDALENKMDNKLDALEKKTDNRF